MKNQTIYLLLFVFITLITSCSNDDNSTDSDIIETTEYVCGEDMTNYSGTICCVTGSEFVNTGETLTYTYSSNRNNSLFNWSVESGSISIVSGENSQTVTVKFGNDFTYGIIACNGSGSFRCGERFTINVSND